MPPRPKYTREEIIDAAYELMEEQGIEAVVAREVGKKLSTTTGPIFTFFSGMEELREAVYFKGMKVVCDYLEEALNYTPAFKSFGLRVIEFAKRYPNVYHLVFLYYGPHKKSTELYNNDLMKVIEPMKKEVEVFFGLDYEQATDVVEKMAVYAQGIASFIIISRLDFPDEKISRDLSLMCLSLVAGWKIKRGDLDQDQMKAMLDNLNLVPEKKPSI